jgi:FkbM family methyltransferase
MRSVLRPLRSLRRLRPGYGKAEQARRVESKVLDVLSKGYAAGPLVRMEYGGAKLRLVAAARSRRDEPASEPYLSRWIEECFRPDEVLYDVGANVGTYALIAATVSLPDGHVYAFEPSFSTYAVLCENVVVNGLGDRVTTLPVALGETTGLVTFRYSSLRPGAAKHNWPTGKTAYEHRVLSFRLDDLVRQGLPLPHHVKIDVDGGEPELLRGAGEVLSSPSLRTLMVELLPWTEDAVVAELERHGLARLHTYVRPPSPVTVGLFARSANDVAPLLAAAAQ